MNSIISRLHKQAQQALNNEEYQQAHHYLMAIFKQDQNFADAYFLMAMIAAAHHNRKKAIELIEKANELSPKNAEYLAQLAKQYALNSEHVTAVKYLDLAVQCSPHTALTLDTIGVAYSKVGLHNKAIAFFKKAVALQENYLFYFNLGVAQTFTGDFEEARKAHQKVLSLVPDYCKSHTALSALTNVSKKQNNITNLKALFQKVSDPDDKLNIGHALAREYEALKDYQQAFESLTLAKQCKLNKIDYNFADDLAMFASINKHFSKTESLSNSSRGHKSKEAMFIVGMPRTGTTLVERILSQHDDVTSVGELEHFGLLLKKMSASKSNRVLDSDTIEATENIDFSQLGKAYIESTRALTGATSHFVDKMPLNVLYVGFILQALPNAKVVCLDRAPLDTIMSNFRQLFAANSYNYNYAYDLATTAKFYVEFKKLTQLWVKLFPDNFYLINYEKLVNNPDVEAQKLIGFCGLTWQEQCLKINENTAPVATASAVQVRQPINNKSIGNWQKYDTYLEEVKQILNLS
ncbi:MAG: tetratricopeptide (TPR) repeat protein [Alteromonadaceae bacterium]|jgi:tetratricopeptide (TPR) repeat protein